MKTLVFDVMCDGRFLMQFSHKWCPAFVLDMDEVLEKLLEQRPSLRSKHIELFQTENIVR